MNISQQKYVVIIVGNIKRILSNHEFDEMCFNKLIFSEDVKIKFYDKLPTGVYDFQGLKIDVDELGDISVIGETNCTIKKRS